VVAHCSSSSHQSPPDLAAQIAEVVSLTEAGTTEHGIPVIAVANGLCPMYLGRADTLSQAMDMAAAAALRAVVHRSADIDGRSYFRAEVRS
jgi:hypothetical protein